MVFLGQWFELRAGLAAGLAGGKRLPHAAAMTGVDSVGGRGDAPAMPSLRAIPLMLALTATISACSSTGGQPGSTPRKPPAIREGRPREPVRTPVKRPPPQAQVQQLPGLEGVIGATPAQLSRQFGAARLDVWEGDARKLQFAGTACVLDVYLYPRAAGAEPQATYVDARRSDGRDVDRAACVRALKK